MFLYGYVSILVLMEVVLRRKVQSVIEDEIEVSILVLMEVVLRLKSYPGSPGHKRVVSILVLMEVVLRPTRAETIARTEMGFNPCFNGSGVKTLQRV